MLLIFMLLYDKLYLGDNMLTFYNDVQNDTALYNQYQEKYQSFIEWYKEAYSKCNDLFLKKINTKELIKSANG